MAGYFQKKSFEKNVGGGIIVQSCTAYQHFSLLWTAYMMVVP